MIVIKGFTVYCEKCTQEGKEPSFDHVTRFMGKVGLNTPQTKTDAYRCRHCGEVGFKEEELLPSEVAWK